LAPARHQVTHPLEVVEEVPAGVVDVFRAEFAQERQRRPLGGDLDGLGQRGRSVAGDQVSGTGDPGHCRMWSEAGQPVHILVGDGRSVTTTNEQYWTVQFRDHPPQPWHLVKGVVDERDVAVEQAAGGEEAADPVGIQVGYDVHEHQAGHACVLQGGHGGEPTQRGPDDHTPGRFGGEHGGHVVRVGREVVAVALVVGDAPEPGSDEDVHHRCPHLTPLTTGVEQQDSRPGTHFLAVEDQVRTVNTPRDGHERHLTLTSQGKVANVAQPRVRRPPDEARRLILDAAERLLAEGGVAAVQVRAIAARVDMTDAGVYHHFGTRAGLMEALLRHGGRKIRAGVAEVLDSWLTHGTHLGELVEALAAFYRQSYGELAVALHAAGWRDDGSGMLDPVVEALHTARPAGTPIEDTRLAVAALHQALATEPLYGPAFRRSAGVTNDVSITQWWTAHLTRSLGLDL